MSGFRILLVEDEPKMASHVKMGLDESHYYTDLAMDGKAGADMAIHNNYDAIILDINLPELNGYEVCKIIRQTKPKLPILILSALNNIENKLSGFDTGADDYLTKPFEFRELLARLKALLIRSGQTVEKRKMLKVADLVIDLDLKEVKRGDKQVELTVKEFDLLCFLVLNKNKVLSRNELLENVWGLNFDASSNVIDVYINFLRKKIDIQPYAKLIYTDFGRGYILKEA